MIRRRKESDLTDGCRILPAMCRSRTKKVPARGEGQGLLGYATAGPRGAWGKGQRPRLAQQKPYN